MNWERFLATLQVTNLAGKQINDRVISLQL